MPKMVIETQCMKVAVDAIDKDTDTSEEDSQNGADEALATEGTKPKSIKRLREKAAVYKLLRQMLAADTASGAQIVGHRQDHSPYLQPPFSHTSISISHSATFVAIALKEGSHGAKCVGVDIEDRKRDKALRLQDRFATNEELELVPEMDAQTRAIMIWTAKEAVYKVTDERHYDFKEAIAIRSLDAEGGPRGRAESRIDGTKYSLEYVLTGDYILCLAQKE